MDVDHNIRPFFHQADGKTILITGASGFVGSSLLRLLSQIKRENDLNIRVMAQYRKRVSTKDLSGISDYVISSIGQDLELPTNPDIVFHCATPASATINVHEPRRMLDLNIRAMDWLLNSPTLTKKTPVIVFTSSGAVYGSQPEDLSHIPETWSGGPSTFSSGIAYAEGKRVAEFLLAEASRSGKVQQSICRLFTFSGVGIPLDQHFAIGNFVRDAIDGRKITVRSDGSSVRSYLDSEDMANWLLKASVNPGNDFPYHVGSEHAISIGELAVKTAEVFGSLTGQSVPVEILSTDSPIDGFKRYVPSNLLTCKVLKVTETVNLDESILKMFQFHTKEK